MILGGVWGVFEFFVFVDDLDVMWIVVGSWYIVDGREVVVYDVWGVSNGGEKEVYLGIKVGWVLFELCVVVWVLENCWGGRNGGIRVMIKGVLIWRLVVVDDVVVGGGGSRVVIICKVGRRYMWWYVVWLGVWFWWLVWKW